MSRENWNMIGHAGEICEELHQIFNSLEPFNFPYDTSRISENGIYVLFEFGEVAHQGKRIVRVGTHTGENQLRSRLNQHFIYENKDRSIFRKNIGRALLHRDNDSFLSSWNLDLTTSAAKQRYLRTIDIKKQREVEKRVSAHIQDNMSFVTFACSDKIERLRIESRLISTISHCRACFPSDTWLGLHSPKMNIRESGLWQEKELYNLPLSRSELDELQGRVIIC
jgi:hypothetical protein